MKVMIATHGHTASGLASTIRLFLGEIPIWVVDAYVEDETEADYTFKIKEFIDAVDDEGAYLFTDILGGSVNQKVLTEVRNSDKKIVVVTNVNVPIILELLACPDVKCLGEIQKLIAEGNVNPQVINVEQMFSTDLIEEDDDEFLS